MYQTPDGQNSDRLTNQGSRQPLHVPPDGFSNVIWGIWRSGGVDSIPRDHSLLGLDLEWPAAESFL